MNALNPVHLLLLLVIVLLLFGASKLPALAKSMGQSARAFKGEMKAMKEEDAAADAAKAATVADSTVNSDVPASQPQIIKNPDNPL